MNRKNEQENQMSATPNTTKISDKGAPFWKNNSIILFLMVLFASVMPLTIVIFSASFIKWAIVIALLVSVAVSAMITFVIVQQTSQQLYELNQWIHEVIAGNLDVKQYHTTNKPVQSLWTTFQMLVQYLTDIRNATEAISRGDYSKLLSDHPPENSLEKSIQLLRKRVTEAGIMAERHLNFLNNVPTPIIIMDQKLEIEYINFAAEQLFQKPVSKCLGIRCKDLMKAEICETGNCHALRSIQTDTTLKTVTSLTINDRQIPVRYTNVPIHDSNDDIVGVMKFIVDITQEMNLLNMAETISKGDYSVEIKQSSSDDRISKALNAMTQTLKKVTEENQRQHWIKTGQTELNIRLRGEQDIQTLVKNIIFFLCDYIQSPVGVFFIEKDGKFKQLSSYAYHKRKSIKNEFEKGEGLVGQAALEKKSIVITQVPPDYMSIQSGLGELTPGAVMVIPLLYHNKVLGVMEFGVLNDFTQTQIAFLELIAENIAVAIHTAKARTRMTTLLAHSQNQAEELKVQQEELRQAYEDLEEQTKRLKESETSLQQQHEELTQSNKALEEQTQLLEKQKDAIRKKNEVLEKQQTVIQEKAQDLEIANRYKSEFLANMSHELRTPLNSILLLSGIIIENKEDNLTDKQLEFAHTINMCGTDLLNLINEVLDLSKVESGKMDLYPENAYIQDIVSVMKKTFQPVADQKKIDFEIMVDPSIPVTIFIDQQRLEQIIKNLLSNAFKFTQEGKISLNIKRPEDFHLSEDMEKIERNSLIVFEVIDTGVGISEDKHKLIFEAFHQGDGTTKRRFGGTGLGLSIVKRIVSLMGGQVHLKSKPGKGSLFWIVLPERCSISDAIEIESPSKQTETQKFLNEKVDLFSHHNEKISPSPSVQNLSPSASVKKDMPSKKMEKDNSQKTVIIVSNIDMMTKHLDRIVSKQGFLPKIFYSAFEAHQYCSSHSPYGVILDLALPDWTCWFFYLAYRNNNKNLPIHWVSGLQFQTDENLDPMFFLKQNEDISTVTSVLDKINARLSEKIKNVLLISSDNCSMKQICEKDLALTCVHKESIKDAIKVLEDHSVDVLMIDTSFQSVKDISSIDKLAQKANQLKLPSIFITDTDIWDQKWIFPDIDQKGEIQKKSFNVMERVTDETLLFFHRLKKDKESLSENSPLKHDKDSVLKGKKILLVDDDMRNVFAISSVLEAKGSTVIVGRNGKEGLKCLTEHSGIHLIIMDIMMPEMDGYEAIKKIREQSHYQKLPIIALTAKAMKKDREKCIEVGADDYMPKPVYPDKLISMLRLWLNK